MPAQRWFWILVGVAVALALASTRIAFFFTEIWWFEDLGYSPVFWTIVKARWLVALAGVSYFCCPSNLAAVMWKRRRLDVVGGLVMPVPVQSPDRLWQ